MRRCHSILFLFAAAFFAASANAQTADLLVSKSAPESATAGDTIDYSIFVFNSGPSSANGVTVTDTLPAGTTFLALNASSTLFTCTTPSTAHHVQLTDAVPANATFVSATVSDPVGAFTCATPAVGTGGNITCTALTLDVRTASDQPTFLFTFRINNGVSAGTVLTNTAT